MFGEDRLGADGPFEGFRILISVLDPGFDGGLELFDIVEDPSPDALSGDFGEQPLDEVEPGTGGRGEVQREAFVPRQPALHGRGLVGGVVVDDQMQIEIGGSLAVDLFEEVQELLGPMAGQAFADDRASRDIESRKERRGAVALVSWVMVPARPFFKGKPGCVRSSAWIWLFSSTESTSAFSGGSR